MGGHASGLFRGTTGEGLPKHILAAKEAESKPQSKHTDTPELRKHITEAYDNGKSGIGGGHEKGAFMAKLVEMGGIVEEHHPCESIDGVEKVVYRLPKKGIDGKPTDQMKSNQFEKTIYDSNKISTDDYTRRGIEAANDAAANDGISSNWSGLDSSGVKWNGHADRGKITTFYPSF